MVIVFGSVNLDLIVRVPRIAQPGETLTGFAFATSPGGKGANQALAAHAARANVAMIGAVGRDDHARAALANLVASGIDVHRIDAVDAATGVALISVTDDGQNAISVVAGANAHARAAQVPDEWLGPDAVVLMQLEVPMAEVEALAVRARQHNVPVILNAAPAAPLPDALWRAVTVLIVNEAEARILGSAAGLPATPCEFARAAFARYGCSVVVTLGAQGALAFGPDGAIEVAAPPIDVRDSTGAGDAFCGAFASAWQRREPPRRAVAEGVAAGTLACNHFGAQRAHQPQALPTS